MLSTTLLRIHAALALLAFAGCDRTVTLHGRAQVWGEDEPLPGETITAAVVHTPAGAEITTPVSVKSSSDGTFSFSALTPGATYRFTIEHDGWLINPVERMAPTEMDEAAIERAVEAHPPPDLRVSVADCLLGRPIAGAVLVFGPHSVATDADGRVLISEVGMPGRTRVVVRADGFVGGAVGKVLGRAILDAKANVRAQPRLRVAYAADPAANSPVGAGFTERLAAQARLGLVSAGGSELGQTPVVSFFVREGKVLRAKRASPDPHWPKVTLECLQSVIVGNAKPPPTLPLRLVQIGDCMLVGVPGEPTTMFAESLERELGTMHSATVIIAGVCGEYCGYLTTTEEYVAQHYEGSSTIWGRSTHSWMRRHLAKLANEPAASPSRSVGRASAIGSRNSARASGGTVAVDPRFEARMKGGAIVGSWRSAKDVQPSLGPGPWLVIEVAGKHVECNGMDLTDQALRTTFERRVGLDRCRWEFAMEVPAQVRAVLQGKAFRVRLLPAEFGLGRGPLSAGLALP